MQHDPGAVRDRRLAFIVVSGIRVMVHLYIANLFIYSFPVGVFSLSGRKIINTIIFKKLN